MTKKTKLLMKVAIVVAITAGVAFALYLLFHTKRTYVTTTESKKNTSVLICEAKTTKDGFFNTYDAYDIEQKIKIVFIENMPDKLNYLYNGTYVSAEVASKASGLLHADYNIYMGIDTEKLTPNFSIIDNTLKINLFASRNQMDTRVGKIFFLTNEEVKNFNTYKDKDLKELYQNKGFSCELETKY